MINNTKIKSLQLINNCNRHSRPFSHRKNIYCTYSKMLIGWIIILRFVQLWAYCRPIIFLAWGVCLKFAAMTQARLSPPPWHSSDEPLSKIILYSNVNYLCCALQNSHNGSVKRAFGSIGGRKFHILFVVRF